MSEHEGLTHHWEGNIVDGLQGDASALALLLIPDALEPPDYLGPTVRWFDIHLRSMPPF